MKLIYAFLFFFIAAVSYSQQTISGTVLDGKSKPIEAANVFIEGTYKGASTDDKGDFSFQTAATGNQTLVVSYLTYEKLKITIDVLNCKDKSITYESYWLLHKSK
jgi:hypothetical protein